ncbi:CLUMA_CG015743, isoform A [Clunio marinus]|uniref:CLUMA_CG015743, isoform A n=1 Tax=Clunio marinus TaxID=568069 RepID=A0A1J1IRV6_9DIPT|nr:CLUMA_CG015743, isoform A [Clunio marinus]
MIDSSFDFPGWTSAIDHRSGRQYFVNLIEKTTTWEDPRIKYKHVYGPAIPMQNLHGSSPKNVQVYPTQNYPAQAFQSSQGQSINASPIPSTKTSNYSHTAVEMSSLSRSSPHTPRVGSLIKNHQQMLHQQQHQQTQETSFSSPTPMETEATVAKINTMFPTASEHHIRLLLKKYHHREAVVISALQVEKHPLTTPGPYTPPVQRSFHATAMALSAFNTPPSSSFGRKSVHLLHGDHLTFASSSNGSPIPMRPQSSSSFYTTVTNATTNMYGSPRFGEQYRSSPKPHSSPKMKLRYLKSMFPKAEETIILDVLATVENNVQKASESLIRMGYEKKEMTPAPRLSHRKKEEYQPQKEVIQPTPPPKPKTAEEKKKMKARMQAQYKDSIPEKIIAMALESVEYSEEKALKILDIVLQEDKDSKTKSEKEKKKSEGVEKNVSFKEPSSSKSIDLDQAAAIENDETMIINSDHSIITTPIESPETDGVTGMPKSAVEYEDATTSSSDASTSDASTKTPVEKIERRRSKARSDSNRSEKNTSVVVGKKESNSKSVIIGGENSKDGKFMSIYTQSNANGKNSNLAKGPRDELLLTDYVTWSGANPDFVKGHRVKATGPNPNIRIERNYTPRGRGSELCKGSKIGLAKGSIYSQISRPNVACN